ncbi:MAG: protein translocase subunit SecD [Clostridia bacterium]|nr:protein translocase subunit SecD [Clostridia bacterium]
MPRCGKPAQNGGNVLKNKSGNKKPVFFVVVIVTVLLSLLAVFGLEIGNFEIKGANQMRFGIDIRGGVEAVYEPKDLDRDPTEAELEAAKTVIETRMDAANITDREVAIDKTSGVIIVRFPWKSDETDFDPQAAVSELGETARLTFRDPDGNVRLEGSDVKKSYTKFDSMNQPEVVLELTSEGQEKFSEVTGELAGTGKPLSIYMDDTLISAPTVKSKITSDTAVIENISTLEEAADLSAKINSGSLPFSLVAKDCQIIAPTLGSGALAVMEKAALLAFAMVCLFMLLYYRLPGLVACIALMLQLVGQLLAVSIPQFTLTLPGIAGIILTMGMGVDANVIVFERIKEELRDGKSFDRSIELGFHRAFTAVFDGNLTTIIVAFVLIIFGSGSILSFGYTLLFGCLMNFISGVAASRMMIRSLSGFKALRNPKYFGVRKVEEQA